AQHERRMTTTLIENTNDYTGFTNDLPVILKLPGTVESGQPNFAVTEDHFFTLAGKEMSLLPPQVAAKLRTSRHLYLGYNLRDWTARVLLYSIWEAQTPTYESWAVIPNADDLSKRYWENCDVEVIEAEVKEYVEGLSAYLFG